MSNHSELVGACVPPFLDLSNFSDDGGFIEGRFCAPNPLDPKSTCCLPCPFTDFLYPQSFITWYRVAESINVSGLILMVFLMITYLCLPVEHTRRHYLNVCLVLSIMLLALGFVVPLAVRPPQCYDEITPNDMFSNLTCAWSGALIIAGGLSVAVWIFIRVLSMHLQICWDTNPGRKFFYGAQGAGWLLIAALFTVCITISGVSFRFGDACHVNAAHSLADFWGPLLGISGAATFLQLATFAYCLHIYIKKIWNDDATTTTNSTGMPSQGGSSMRIQSARAIYRRISKIIWLQWRSIMIVTFILVDVIFFSVTFVYLNGVQSDIVNHFDQILPWAICLMKNPGIDERVKCLDLGARVFVNEATVNAILLMLALAGIECFLLLSRWSMFTGWVELIRGKVLGRDEFVSLEARNQTQAQARSYEMFQLQGKQPPPMVDTRSVVSPATLASPNEVFSTPNEQFGTPYGGTPYGSQKDDPTDYFHGKEMRSIYRSNSNAQRTYSPPPMNTQMARSPPHSPTGSQHGRIYRTPSNSFSSPRTPSAAYGNRLDWDPRSTHARGGLGFHPTSVVMEDEDDRR